MREVRTRAAAAACLPFLLAAISACDIVNAHLNSQESAEWRKTFALQPGGRVEISNVNGRIDVEPSTGNAVEVVAVKSARAGSQEAARQALEQIEIVDSSSSSVVKIETKLPRSGGMFNRGGYEVRYTVKVPPTAPVQFTTVNGGITVLGLGGPTKLESTNGGIQAREIAGPIEATTTNGGVEVDLTKVADPGVTLNTTNGGIRLRMPADAKATITASVANGGIDASGLTLDTTESSRRRLEARLNGGGPPVKIEGTNGGIRISGR